jgi:hypothetical protein
MAQEKTKEKTKKKKPKDELAIHKYFRTQVKYIIKAADQIIYYKCKCN